MNRKYFSFITLSLIFVMLILSVGCGVRINGKEYELFTSRDKDKDNFSIVFRSDLSDTQQISEDKQEGEQFVVSDNVGDISIKKSENSQIKIKIDKKVRGSSEGDIKTILDNLNIVLERNGEVIEAIAKTKDGDDFRDWLKDNFKLYQVTLDFDISLPEGINIIEANIGAGNIGVQDVSAKLSLDTGAGNIDIKDVKALEDNVLSTGAGNIDFNGNINNTSSFEASTGAGNVKFQVPEDTKMSIEADTGIGILSGSFIKSKSHEKFNFKGDINGGGPTVKLDTGVGNVKVDKN